MVSQDRVYALLVVLIFGMAASMISSQSMAEARSEILERIRPIGQVRIEEGQTAPAAPAQPQASPETSAAPTAPVAVAEPAPVAAPTQPAPAPSRPKVSNRSRPHSEEERKRTHSLLRLFRSAPGLRVVSP